MPITERDILKIEKSGKRYLLLHGSKHFYLIRSDSVTDETKFAKLLSVFPCEQTVLERMGLHCSIFKTENLRKVVLHGCNAGDILELYLKSNTGKYKLAYETDKETIQAFFAPHSVVWDLPPVWTGLDLSLVSGISWGLNAFSFFCAIMLLVFGATHKLWSVLCLLAQTAALVLVLAHPESFTFYDSSNSTKAAIDEKMGHLSYAYITTAFLIALRSLHDFSYPGLNVKLLLLCVLHFTIQAVLVIVRDHRLRAHIGTLICALLLMTAVSYGAVTQANHLFDWTEPEFVSVRIAEKTRERMTRGVYYSCDVLLPGGETLSVQIDSKIYNEIQVGGKLGLLYHQGAFNAPYYTLAAPQE